MPRRMCTSSFVVRGTVEQLVQTRHQLLGRCGVQVADIDEGRFQVRQQPAPPAHQRAPGRGARLHRKAARGLAQVIRQQLHGLGEVERTVVGVRRD